MSGSEDRCVFEDITYSKLRLSLVCIGYDRLSYFKINYIRRRVEYYKVNVREGIEGGKKDLLGLKHGETRDAFQLLKSS